MPSERSLATGQRSLADPDVTYPLFPPLTDGCPETSDDERQYPVEVTYDYDAVDPALFEETAAGPGIDRWAPLLPPLSADGLGEGGSALVSTPALADWVGVDELYVKDESGGPTWSQKDRLVRPAVSAAVRTGAEGVVASSSGNHGASAAAYAARNDLDCVVLTSPNTPGAVQEWIASYGGATLAVAGHDDRRIAVDRLAAEHGYHPVTTRTPSHTGHPFGSEGYKTIAYEVYAQLEAVPGTVAAPTCFAELLYGVWKGFRELQIVGAVERTPRMVACEPAARGPLATALSAGETFATVDAEPTEAYSIKATTNTYRGVRAVEDSDGIASTFSEAQLKAAGHRLARTGLWQEDSGAAGLAGLDAAVEDGRDLPEPVVCIATASGFKDGRSRHVPEADSEWPAIRRALESHPNVTI